MTQNTRLVRPKTIAFRPSANIEMGAMQMTFRVHLKRPHQLARAIVCKYTPLAVSALMLCGCIERTLTIQTEPEGARVYLNDQDVGRSPVTVPFTWYGDYDVVIRKEGYDTLRANHRLYTPWYELPGIDFFTECLMPFTVRDHHEFPVYTLKPRMLPEQEDVVLRAEEMRERALFAKD